MKSKNLSVSTFNNEEWSADRIKELTMSKIQSVPVAPIQEVPRRFTKRFAVAAAVVVLAITTTAFAVGHYLGSFDRLREIVGDERADMLQPIEVGNVKIREQFRVDLVAVGVSANVADLYITLEDLYGSRLEGDIGVWAFVGIADNMSSFTVAHFSEIDRTDSGIITLHSRAVFPFSIVGQSLVFELDSILYNYRTSELSIDVDLYTITEQAPVAMLWDTPILPPHLHDIEIALEGFESAGEISISSIGIIDGRLHIQEMYDMTALSQWVGNKVSLIDPKGEIVYPLRESYDNTARISTASVSFRIDEDGNFYNDRGYNFIVDFPFRENVFEVDLERLSEYRLVALFHTNDRIDLHLTVRFEVEHPDADVEPSGGDVEFLFADDLNIWVERYSTYFEEVQITPHTVILTGIQGQHQYPTPADALLSMSSMQVRIHMADGTVVDVVLERSTMVSPDTRELVIVMNIIAESIDPDSVVSIEIDGEVIGLR